MINHYPLVFAENYYISVSGYVYYKDKSNRVESFFKGEHLYVTINSKEYKLLNLMIEYFARDKMHYKRIKIAGNKKDPFSLPLWKITFNDAEPNNLEKSEYDDRIMFRFKCDSKARNSNKRCYNSIDKHDVLSVLKKYDFNCKYCGKELGFFKWHLDHIKPLALGGLNIVSNLAPACAFCNLMKGAFDENEFLMKCARIVKHNNILTNG